MESVNPNKSVSWLEVFHCSPETAKKVARLGYEIALIGAVLSLGSLYFFPPVSVWVIGFGALGVAGLAVGILFSREVSSPIPSKMTPFQEAIRFLVDRLDEALVQKLLLETGLGFYIINGTNYTVSESLDRQFKAISVRIQKEGKTVDPQPVVRAALLDIYAKKEIRPALRQAILKVYETRLSGSDTK